MFENDQKIVEFGKYCPKCKHCSKSESEDPCRQCLDNPTNTWSRKPLYFKESDLYDKFVSRILNITKNGGKKERKR